MGLETAAIIGIAASAAAGGASIYATNKAAQGARETNDLQIGASRDLQKDAQQYNTQMYERNLADSRENYQTQLADARANYEMQRDDQEAFYNKYLSASGMAKQLRQAGVNPASYFGAGKGISQPASMPGVNATNMQTPAALSSPLGSIGGLNNPNLAYASLVPQLTKSITDLSQAGLMDAQKKEISTLLESKLHKLMADIGGQEALNTQLQLENEITQAFGKKKAAAEIKSLTQQAFFYAMSGKTEKAKAALTSIQEQIGRQDLKIKSEQALNIATLLKKQINFVDEQIKTEQAKQKELGASASAHVSQASYFKALTNTEDKLRDGKFEALSLSNDLNTIEKFLMGNDLAVSDATTVQRIDALFQQFYREGIITKQAWFDYQQAKKWDDKERFIRYLGTTVHAVNEASQSVTTPYGVVRNADIRQRFNDIYERSQHGTRTNYSFGENGWSPVWKQEY